MPPLLQLQKLLGKGDGGLGKKCLCVVLGLTRRLRVRGKKTGASYSTSNKLLHSDYGPPKMLLKLAM